MTTTKDAKDPSKRSAIDRLLDLGIFAPLGMLLERDRLVTQLAQVGRKQVEFSRSLGRVALRGIVTRIPRSAPGTVARSVPDAPGRAVAPAAAPADDQASAEPVVAPGWSGEYDAMSARDIIAALAEISPEQLRWVRQAEVAGKSRVTVIRAVDRKLS